MSTRTEGRNRRKLSIGTRLCPPASPLASPSACASAATAASTLSATRYSNGGGSMRSWHPLCGPMLEEACALSQRGGIQPERTRSAPLPLCQPPRARRRMPPRGAAMTTAKTGAEHIKSLKDGRTVYIDGKVVDDVTEHPAFRNSVRSAAALYDFQAREENAEAMTFTPDGANRRVNRCWQLPRNHAEMVARRKAMQAWSTLHCGF